MSRTVSSTGWDRNVCPQGQSGQSCSGNLSGAEQSPVPPPSNLNAGQQEGEVMFPTASCSTKFSQFTERVAFLKYLLRKSLGGQKVNIQSSA